MSYKVLGLPALMGAVLLAGLSTAALGQTLRVSSYLPPSHSFQIMLERWAEELGERSNGELSLEIFPAGQLGPAPRQYDLVSQGAVDIAIVLHSATPGRYPLTELVGLPLTFPSEGDNSAVTSRRLTELADEYLADEHPGTRILWMGVTPPVLIGTRDVNPDAIENLRGLRVRYSGTTWQSIIELLGASPMPVEPGETSESLARGIVNSATFPYQAMMSFGVADELDYVLEPGLASNTWAVLMNEGSYDRLSEEHRAIIDETTGPDRAQAFGELLDSEEQRGREYAQSVGVQSVQLSEEGMSQLIELLSPIAGEVIARAEAAGRPAQEFLADYTR